MDKGELACDSCRHQHGDANAMSRGVVGQDEDAPQLPSGDVHENPRPHAISPGRAMARLALGALLPFFDDTLGFSGGDLETEES